MNIFYFWLQIRASTFQYNSLNMNTLPRKPYLTYPLLMLCAVMATFAFKLLWVPEHHADTSTRTATQAVVIEDINATLSPDDKAFLQAQLRWQMAFHRQYHSLPEPLPVKVRLWPSTTTYRAYQAEVSKTSTSSKGFYSGARRELVINGEKPGYRQTLAHEAQHLLLRVHKARPEPWLSEGLAEYFETLAIQSNDRALSQAQPDRVERIRAFSAQGQLPPLPAFFDESKRDWRAREARMPYVNQDTAWALVYFLMQQSQGREALLAVLKAAENKAETRAASQIIAGVYPLSALRTDFARFLADIPAEHELPFSP